MKFDYDQVITHGGTFNASDVFGVGLCRLINPNIKIVRTDDIKGSVERAKNIGDRAIIYNAKTNLRAYSGFEQLWYDFGNYICPDQRTKTRVTQSLVVQLSKKNILVDVIEKLNNKPNSTESNSVAFHRAMNVAMILLYAQIKG